jgi:hypothetical protein
MCIFYSCTKILLRAQKFPKQALFTTVKEIIHDINSPLIFLILILNISQRFFAIQDMRFIVNVEFLN